MNRLLLILLMCWCGLAAAQNTAADALRNLAVLCYHDVRENLTPATGEGRDAYAIDVAELINQFGWLREHGYVPVSLQQIQDAQAGIKSLPDKPVLLTFDDGYRSVYTHVYPLLRLFRYPAVVAVVGHWLESPAEGAALAPGRTQMASWEELRAMRESGWVEIASHSFDLHRGVLANPQGNELPAATSRLYDAARGRYEGDAAYEARIREDLARNAQLIALRTGAAPRAIVWPYGRYNGGVQRIARELGMPVSLTLDALPHSADGKGITLHRKLIDGNPNLRQFVETVTDPYPADPVRAVQVDLDYVYDPDPVRQEANLSLLLDRIAAMGINTVYLQAYADPDGDGAADALYFPSRHMPMRADLFGRAAWQLRTRAGVNVFAWMPLLAFKLPDSHPAVGRVVETLRPGALRYHRLSPFNAEARRVITEIYEDLGRHATFAGLLFHDDATLDDFEDASADARRHYKEIWGIPQELETLRDDPFLALAWGKRKTQHLIDFSRELATAVRNHRAPLQVARNLYAQPVLNPVAETWYAQSFPAFLENYDQVVLMAMPYLERARRPERWLAKLAQTVEGQAKGKTKIVFELQSRDWNTRKALPDEEMAKTLRVMQLRGTVDLAYYPDDFHVDSPALRAVRPMMSLRSMPR